MREIKFRGWDEKNKEMVYNINLLFSNRLNDCFEEYEECGLKIMQYTGLKDVNGVEIYEGDILKCVDEIGTQIAPVEYAETIASFIVRYKKGDKHYYSPLNKGDLSRDLYLQETEIIGNIYENSELLE